MNNSKYKQSSYDTYPSSRYNYHNPRGNNHNHRSNNHHIISSDDESSSTHSVRVSKLIEKIKASQQRGGGAGGVGALPGDAFSYMPSGRGGVHHHQRVVASDDYNNSFEDYSSGGSKGELIYSRVEGVGKNRGGKRTVRERVLVGGGNRYGGGGTHKTTVLLNNDDVDDVAYDGGVATGYKHNNLRNNNLRYFGEETDYEYDRVLSNKFKNSSSGVRGSSVGSGGGKVRGSVIPKIILHEEAVADIPNGVGRSSSRVNLDSEGGNGEQQQQQRDSGGKRFLGGFLTLKRGGNSNKDSSFGRSGTHSPSSRRTTSYLNVPSSTLGGSTRRLIPPQQQQPDNYDSSSSPKYYVPYYRSTPTLYNNSNDVATQRVGSSAGGSVLSGGGGGGSYVGKHVTRSMSMKAPWEPRHKTNEINYYNEGAYTKKLGPSSSSPAPPQDQRKQRGSSTLKRSKSMPGKKLTSLIGNWVSRGTLKRENAGNSGDGGRKRGSEDEEKLIKSGGGGSQGQQQPKSSSNWGRFTLLRFGKGKKKETQQQQQHSDDSYNYHSSSMSPPRQQQQPQLPSRPARNRTSVSPLRGASNSAGNPSYNPHRYDSLSRGSRGLSSEQSVGHHHHHNSRGGTLLRGRDSSYY